MVMKLLLLGNDNMPEFHAVKNCIPSNIQVICNQYGEKCPYNFDYDVGISFMYNFLVPSYEIQNRPWYNFHPGPLPEYPGRNIAYQAIIDQAEIFGATLHVMNEEFDAGPIISKKSFPILPSDTAQDLVQKSRALLVQLFVENIDNILTGNIKTSPNFYRPRPQTIINDEIILHDESLKREIRARTCYPYFAKLIVNGRTYKAILEE
jgi:methionyl-tRNA formyltransferase